MRSKIDSVDSKYNKTYSCGEDWRCLDQKRRLQTRMRSLREATKRQGIFPWLVYKAPNSNDKDPRSARRITYERKIEDMMQTQSILRKHNATWLGRRRKSWDNFDGAFEGFKIHWLQFHVCLRDQI